MEYSIYPLVAGPIPAETLTDFNSSVDSYVNVSSTSFIPDAPNVLTITDEDGHFVTFKYGSLHRGNDYGVVSDIEYIEGDAGFLFPAGCPIVRAITKYDDDARLLALDSKVDKNQGVEHSGKVLTVGADGIVTPSIINSVLLLSLAPNPHQ